MKKYITDLADLRNEVWKDVVGYDGYYQISNMGRIKRLPRIFYTAKGDECLSKEKIKRLRLSRDKSGRTNVFCEYCVDNIRKRYNFSKQIALHFIDGYNGETLYFIDGDRDNCEVTNLIVVSESNVMHLYNNNIIIPPNHVSEMLHKMGYKKCSICKEIKLLPNFSKANRNRDTNNNCQLCINDMVYEYRNK